MGRSLLFVTVLLVACSGGKGPEETDPGEPSTSEDTTPSTTEPTTTQPTTPTTPTTDPFVEMGAPQVLIGIPNVDDDTLSGRPDWFDEAATDADFEELVITASDYEAVSYRLSWEGTDGMRVWSEGEVVLNDTLTELVVERTDELSVLVEFSWFNDSFELTVEELDDADEVLSTAVVELSSSPLLLTHHLLDSEQIWTIEMTLFGDNNAPLVAEYRTSFPTLYDAISKQDGGGDQWVQDEIEVGYATSPSGKRLNVVVDSIRDRGLKSWAASLNGPDMLSYTWGNGFANTLDSFGNLEITPPIDGYPAGRIYYGSVPGPNNFNVTSHPEADALYDFLAAQEVQEPFTIDTTWLCVGHVDEFMSWVPDPTAPRGFRFVYTDVDLAWQIMEAMDPETVLTKFAPRSSHGYITVQEMLDDTALRDLNEDLKLDYLDPILEKMKLEVGLTDEEIIRLPGLFEEACGPLVAALQPGMANLFVVNEGGQSYAVLADPFMRTDVTDQSADPFIDEVKALMPSSLELHFTDDWDMYHAMLGEVHCGTNGIRTPVDEWWVEQDVEVAR